MHFDLVDLQLFVAVDLPAGVGVAVVPEAAARRCAQSMPLALLAIRDAWANRRLAICARSFASLPRPARLLVDHLRKAAR